MTRVRSKTPRVSVLLPVRNGQPYLGEAIESLLAQTFEDFEVLAIDDGSTDDTLVELARYHALDPRVRPVCLPPSGQAQAMNLGLQLARGELIARMDADDVALPERLARQVEFLEANPEVAVLGSQYELMDAKGASLGYVAHPCGAIEVKQALARHWSALCHPAVMMRREAALRVGGYRPYFAPAEDFDFWLRMSQVGDLGNLDEVLLRYRFHPSSLSFRQARRQAFSVLVAARLFELAEEAAPGDAPPEGGLTRTEVLAFGIDEETIDRLEMDLTEWYSRIAGRMGRPDAAMGLAHEVCAEMASPRIAALTFLKASCALAAAGFASSASRLEADAAERRNGSPPSGRKRASTTRASALPLTVHRVAGRVDPDLPRLGSLEICELQGGRRLRLVGWGSSIADTADPVVELHGAPSGKVVWAARAVREDIAEIHGDDRLLSGFDIEIELDEPRSGAMLRPGITVVSADGTRQVVTVGTERPAVERPRRRRTGKRILAGGSELRQLDGGRPPRLSSTDVACYMTVRDEVAVLPLALEHQRRLGVRHFFVVDNGSRDGTTDYLLDQPDVSVYHTNGSFARSNYGFTWLEALLDDQGSGRWCLVLDADEGFVYPGSEEMDLTGFARYLSRSQADALPALCIDMYSDRAIRDTHLEGAGSLLEACPFLDETGYYRSPRTTGLFYATGGARARLFWPEYDETRKRMLGLVREEWDEPYYLQENEDVAEAVGKKQGFACGFDHFRRVGRLENRPYRLERRKGWREDEYLQANPDVEKAVEAGAFSSGLDHFVKCGQFEDRFGVTPPCMALTPLVRWKPGMRFTVARHGLWREDREIVYGAVRCGVLHFKLTAGLLELAATESKRGEHWEEGAEYKRYAKILRTQPDLTAYGPGSVRFESSEQLCRLGLLQGSSTLDSHLEALETSAGRELESLVAV